MSPNAGTLVVDLGLTLRPACSGCPPALPYPCSDGKIGSGPPKKLKKKSQFRNASSAPRNKMKKNLNDYMPVKSVVRNATPTGSLFLF